MYKVLLVDDERIIREGISSAIEWEEQGLQLMGTAQNGLEAYEMIKGEIPHIVITDVKMPGMNGLELLAKVREELPEIVFVILSGYGEFEFASNAMQNGVRYYLLKPCDQEEITSVLNKIVTELKQKERKEGFLKEIKYNMERVLPQVKEQFLRDLILSRIYNKRDCQYFQKLFNIENIICRLILFNMEKECDYIEKFALKKIAEEVIQVERVFLSTTLDENVLLIIQTMDFTELTPLLNDIKEFFYNYYTIDISIAVSDENSFENIPQMYKETKECLKYRFYLDEGSIITKIDIDSDKTSTGFEMVFDYDKVAALVKSGDVDGLHLRLEEFFDKLSTSKFEIDVAKTYCMELFLMIVRQGSTEVTKRYVNHIIKFQEMNSLKQICDFIKKTSGEIARCNYEHTTKKHSELIETVIACIHENLGNEEMSLSWIAKKILYMNVDYLGKLFYKETKEKFTQYVMRVRLDKVKEFIESTKDYKIYEIAKMTGFGDNSQYLGQMFKKFCGYTPSEYKSIIRS